MNVDDKVRAAVEQISRSIQPPVADPAGIRARAHQTSRRRNLAGLGIAAAMLVGVSSGVWYVAGRGDGPAPATPPSTTHGSEIPGTENAQGAIWYAEGVLHDGAQSVPVEGKVATNLAVVAHGVLYGDGSGNVIYQRQDGSTAVIGEHAPLGPSGDPTSDVVVWFEDTGGGVELVVYDVAKDLELGRENLGALDLQPPDAMVGLLQPPVLWVGDGKTTQAAVYFLAKGSLWRYDWTSGAGARQLDGELSSPLDVGGDVVAVAGPGNRSMTFKNLNGQELSSAQVEPDGALSHDGRYYVGYAPDGTVVVDTATGEARPLDLGPYSLVLSLTWARGNTVVGIEPDINADGKGSVVACDAVSLRCQNGPQVDNFTDIVLPTLPG